MPRFEKAPHEEKLEIVPDREVDFDYRAALNNKDFLNFLAEHSDAAELDLRDESNRETIEQRYKTYEQREFLKANLPGFYKEELEPRFDIDVDQKDLVEMNDFITHEALVRPAEIKTRFEDLSNLFKYRKENAELEAKIDELGGKEHRKDVRVGLRARKRYLEEEKRTAESATGKFWFVNPKNWELIQDMFRIKDRATRRDARSMSKDDRPEYFKRLDRLSKEVESLDTRDEFLKLYPGAVQGRKERVEAITASFFSDFEPARRVFETLIQNTNETLDTLISKGVAGGSMEKMEETQAYLERVTIGTKKISAPEVEAFVPSLELFQARINEQLGDLVIRNITKAVDDFKVGNQPLEALEKQFRVYLDREKLGSRDNATIKSLVMSRMNNEIERLLQAKPRDYTEKILLLKVLFEKVTYHG